MMLRLFVLTIALCGLAMLDAPRALAQTSPLAQSADPSPPPHHARHRIEISPRPLLYRRCVDWYELQHRPNGTVLYPQMRCWWVRG